MSSDSAAGASSAPNAPWAAREITSMSKPVAAPPTIEATAKPTSPTMNARLRPNRSDIRPPSSSRLPKASAYAVMTHCRCGSVKPRSACADGSAMFTMVLSRTTISCAIAMTASTHHRRREARSGADEAASVTEGEPATGPDRGPATLVTPITVGSCEAARTALTVGDERVAR